jgi:hypothetical protein
MTALSAIASICLMFRGEANDLKYLNVWRSKKEAASEDAAGKAAKTVKASL